MALSPDRFVPDCFVPDRFVPDSLNTVISSGSVSIAQGTVQVLPESAAAYWQLAEVLQATDRLAAAERALHRSIAILASAPTSDQTSAQTSDRELAEAYDRLAAFYGEFGQALALGDRPEWSLLPADAFLGQSVDLLGQAGADRPGHDQPGDDRLYDAIVAAHLAVLAHRLDDWALFQSLFRWAVVRGQATEARYFGNLRLPDRWLAWFADRFASHSSWEPSPWPQAEPGSEPAWAAGRGLRSEAIAAGRAWFDRDRHTITIYQVNDPENLETKNLDTKPHSGDLYRDPGLDPHLYIDNQRESFPSTTPAAQPQHQPDPASPQPIPTRPTILDRCSQGHLPYVLRRGLQDAPPAQAIAGTVGYAVARWSEDNYYHWLFDTLPLLGDLGHDRPWQDYSAIVVNHRNHRFQRESLALLGVPKDRVRSALDWPHVRADRLIVPPVSGMGPIACQFLRDVLRDRALAHVAQHGLDRHLPQPLPQRLYLKRGSAARRRICNEADIINLLEPLGFCAIALDQLSLASQIALLAQAAIVVGPHGAAMANLVFAQPGTQVLELFASSYIDNNFQTLAEVLKLNYRKIIYRITPDEQARLDLDWIARLPVLQAAIDPML